MRLLFGLLLVPLPLFAQALTFPAGAESDAERLTNGTEHALPVGPLQDGEIKRQVFSGTRTDQVWRITPPQSVDSVAQTLLGQLADLELIYDCQATICGGFDFRFALDVLPEPGMHVDISDYRYLVAANDDATQVVALVVSRSDLTTFVQVTTIGPASAVVEDVTDPEPPPLLVPDQPVKAITAPLAEGAITGPLQAEGHAVLDDLIFETGSADLGPGEFASLKELADWMLANPDVTLGIVGHTDAVGGLDANINLSRRRAASVVERLVSTYGVPRSQIEALGAGYLAPRTTNQTEEGRQMNRRVEVILTGVIATESD